jgi:hypothetical protein
MTEAAREWDVFICHAHEDKVFVDSLAKALRDAGLKVWYDDFELAVGDSLRMSIDRGLVRSRFGIVVLSKSFFEKRWTQYELDGLVEKDLERKVILPIWHGIQREDLLQFSPWLADKVAIRSTQNLKDIVTAVVRALSIEQFGGVSSSFPVDDKLHLEKPRLDLLRHIPVQTDVIPNSEDEPPSKK